MSLHKEMVELDGWDVVEQITLEHLHYCYSLNDAFPNEPTYKDIKKALKTVIKYMSTPEQYKEWKNGI